MMMNSTILSKAIVTVFTLAVIVSCSKKEDTATSTSGSTSSTSSTGSTTPSQTLVVDGVNMPKAATVCDTSQGYLTVAFGGSGGNCQVIFAGTNPAAGTYSSNWATAMGSGDCKAVLQLGSTIYWSPQGGQVQLTKNNGKYHVVFSGMVFIEDMNTTPGPGRKTVAGNYGCD